MPDYQADLARAIRSQRGDLSPAVCSNAAAVILGQTIKMMAEGWSPGFFKPTGDGGFEYSVLQIETPEGRTRWQRFRR